MTSTGRLRRIRALAPARSDWSGVRPGKDLAAGMLVGLVALPLALGFGESAGLGARAGVITAIVAGAVAAVFGGSRVQISGPTGAMTVVLVPIVATHGPNGVLVVALLAGMLLIALGGLGVGRTIRYVPIPVVEGFTLGIAAIIMLQQLPPALGVHVRAEKVLVLAQRAVQAWVQQPDWVAPGLTAMVAMVIVLVSRWWPLLPGALVVVVLATLGNAVSGRHAEVIGQIPASLPKPRLPEIPWASIDQLLLPAVAVAALAGLESLLSATVADAMSVGRRHDPDRELVGQGLANLAAPLFGGVPATAAIARTAVNIRSGATSRLAALVHSAVLLLIVLVMAEWVGEIPLAALAGVLVATAIQMVRVSSLRALLRSTRADAAVLVTTTAATVLLDLVLAVMIGLVVAGFFALRSTAREARIDEVPIVEGDATEVEEPGQALLDEHIVAYLIDGPLFFAAAHGFLLELADIATVEVAILRMSRVTTIDATGAAVLADAIEGLERRGITVLLSGIRGPHEQVLRRLGVYERLAHDRHVFATTPEAIAHARQHVAHLLGEEVVGCRPAT